MNEHELALSIGEAATLNEHIQTEPDTLEATQFKDYVIEAKLGEGTFGKVYRAHHVSSPEISLALKVIPTLGEYEDLLREPALLSGLNHPGIVRVIDFFPNENRQQLILAMEYVGGGDLKQAIDEAGTFPSTVVKDFLIQMASALILVHRQGIVHRDFKPANILLDRQGPRVRYVLSDFGVGLKQEGVRHEKKVAGTYLYMAPEQLRGRPVAESDLWSLGVIAYKMLTGQYPFPGPTPVELMKQIQLTTPTLPSEALGTAIDHELEHIILRLLDRSETERIGSAVELLKLLGAKETSVSGTGTTIIHKSASRFQQRVQSLDTVLQRGIRRNYLWMFIWLALMVASYGLLNGIVSVGAMGLIYHAHAKARTRFRHYAELVLAGLLLLVMLLLSVYESAFVEGSTLSSMLKWLSTKSSSLFLNKLLPILLVAFSFLGWLFPIWACERFGRANKLQRDRMLLYSSSKDATSSESYLQTLRTAVDYRFEDVSFHLKYAEALAARGDDRAAAVEARLLLETDPYHFVGNLLLAQCYYRLGLFQECRQVCEQYLSVAGYSFEFNDLYQQSLQHEPGGRP